MNIAFIPARCGSKSIPHKNVNIICGKPLIFWSLFALSNSKIIDQIYVAVDCKKIKDIVLNFNFKKVKIFNRKKENATNTATTESVMMEFIDSKDFSDNDLFLLVQVTTPFTLSKDFDNAVDRIKNSKNIDSVVSCVESKRFFWKKDGNPINYDYTDRPRRQDFEGQLMENGAFYINYINNIKTYRNRLSGNISPYIMPYYSGFEADEEDDWLIIERLMYKHVVPKQTTSIIKLFATDVDGVLTDAGMYYDNNGRELKKFNTHDGMGFQLLRENGIKTAIITSENTNIVKNRSKILQVDYLFQGVANSQKLQAIEQICHKENIQLSEVAYIGDDINDFEVLSAVGLAACPNNATQIIKNMEQIHLIEKSGGNGAVREFVEKILNDNNTLPNKK